MLVSPLRASVTATDADGAALRRYVTVALPPSATDRLPVLAVRVGVVVPPPTVNGTAAVVVDSAGLALSKARAAAVWAPLATPVALNAYGAVVSLPTTVPSTRNSTRLIGPSTSLAVAASGIAAPAANVAPLVGLVSATVGAVLVGGAPPQLTPLTVNAVGFGLLPTPRAVEADRGRGAGAEVAVPVEVAGGDRAAGLGPGGRPALLHALAGVGEGEAERPAGERVAEVPERDVGGEAAGPVVGRIDDVTGDGRVGGGHGCDDAGRGEQARAGDSG